MTKKNKMHGCLYRLIGRCKHCVIDEDTSHHPNNYDCPNFKPIGVFSVEEKTEKLPEKTKEDYIMPFYFKINKIKIIDNKESGFLFFHKDLANITLESFFATSDEIFPKLDKYKAYSSAKDTESKEVAIADMIVDTLKNRTTIKIDCVKDNQILTFGDTGCALYRSGTIPNDIGWCLMAIENDQEIRNLGTSIEAVMKHPNFKNFVDTFMKLVSFAKNPAFSAAMAIIKYIGECVATSMKNNKDDMVGLLYMSLNKWEHYPNGERKAEGIVDLTGNMLVDYSIFGFQDA